MDTSKWAGDANIQFIQFDYLTEKIIIVDVVKVSLFGNHSENMYPLNIVPYLLSWMLSKVTSTVKIYQELVIKSLQGWRWLRKLSIFYKTFKSETLCFLFDATLSCDRVYESRWNQKDTTFRNFLTSKNYFIILFLRQIIKWNKLDISMPYSYWSTQTVFLSFKRPFGNSLHNATYCISIIAQVPTCLSKLF